MRHHPANPVSVYRGPQLENNKLMCERITELCSSGKSGKVQMKPPYRITYSNETPVFPESNLARLSVFKGPDGSLYSIDRARYNAAYKKLLGFNVLELTGP